MAKIVESRLTSESTSLIMKESGVNDLPTRQKMFFAMAIKCERQGEAVQADEYLDKALKC